MKANLYITGFDIAQVNISESYQYISEENFDLKAFKGFPYQYCNIECAWL